MDSEFDGINDYINSESDEGEESNEIGQINDNMPSFYTRFKIRNVDEEVFLQDQTMGEN